MRHDSHFVEQLVRADELPIGRKIAIHLIEANPDQPRNMLGDLQDLKESILQKGILEPILVRPRDDGRFTIISGERRFRAAMEAGLGEIPCIEMAVTDAEMTEIALIENLQRKDLSPLEEAEGYLVLQERHQYTHEQIARVIGKSRVTITETLSLARLPDRVKEECRRADIRSKTFLLELSRLGSEREMLAAVAQYAGGSLLSRDSLRQAKREGQQVGAAGSEAVPRHRKNYELVYEPEHRKYSLSLVVKGTLRSRDEILDAVRDLIARIGAGSIDLATNGRFVGLKEKGDSMTSQETVDGHPDDPVDDAPNRRDDAASIDQRVGAIQTEEPEG